MKIRHVWVSAAIWMATGASALCAADTILPPGVRAVWDIQKAYRETTATRERVCLNGLWRWQPAKQGADAPPEQGWRYFKVPGCWPGREDYESKDCQTVFGDPAWGKVSPAQLDAAWYQREFAVPADWTSRRITIYAEYLNSYAAVFIDGKKAGEIRYPAGELDVTSLCQPGQKYVLSMMVIAMPLEAVELKFTDTLAAKKVKGEVERRGLCGDVYLVGTPTGTRLSDVKVDTSVRNWQIRFEAGVAGANDNDTLSLRAKVTDHGKLVKQFDSQPFHAADLLDGRHSFTADWHPEKLWDLNTPGNTYEVQLSLLDGAGKVLDEFAPVRFGFREFWIDGRDFRLNGSRVFLSCIPLDNAQIGAGLANYSAVRETLHRLKSFGVNFVYTHNYGCEPGTHLSFADELRAADDEGMLVAFSQPHFGHYDWKAEDADQNNGYARDAEFYVRAAENHPSVVMYATSHNACGGPDDMDPDAMDGLHNDMTPWALRGSKLAMRAQAIIKRFDSSRIVYHHSGGNVGAVFTTNFYTNFTPAQEMSDWFTHWSQAGVKPVFLCEFGTPLTWDWAMYRGWYKGKREWGSAQVPWGLCLAEWNAQFFGDNAYRITDVEKQALRWENGQYQAGNVWHRWDYPRDALGNGNFPMQQTVFASYLTDEIRAFRALGLSGVCYWDHQNYWSLRPNANHQRQELKVDWDNLQKPGFSPDYVGGQCDSPETGYALSDWVPSPAAQAIIRNNGPVLAYIAGGPEHLTGKDHNYPAGAKIQKQIIVINNSRAEATCDCQWSLALPAAISGTQHVTLPTGEQQRIPVNVDLPADTKPGSYGLSLTAKFGDGQVQKDTFTIDVTSPTEAVKSTAKIALFDPKGQTSQMLKTMGVAFQNVDATADLSGFDTLVIGKAALSVDGPGPDLRKVGDGLKVIVFEQTADALEKRLGFRVAEYGMRQVFERLPDHPVLAGVLPENLRDWRGEATLSSPRLKYESTQLYQFAPVVKWCDIPVTRVWRCGCYGNVASVVIEKPACGDFMPLLDCGFALQYSPLMEYRQGRGMVLFCQLDVTGRSEADPTAQRLAGNIFDYVANWKPAPQRTATYVGEPAGKAFLQKAGIDAADYDGGDLSADQTLVIGPGGAAKATVVSAFLEKHGHVLAIGLDESEAGAALPVKVTMRKSQHIASFFAAPAGDSPLAGVAPADVFDRQCAELPLVSGGANVLDDGALAQADGVVLCQIVPWKLDYAKQYNLKLTYRRAACLVNRVLGNMGVEGKTPLLERFGVPAQQGAEKRWLEGLYLDAPEEWDDPYRFFGW